MVQPPSNPGGGKTNLSREQLMEYLRTRQAQGAEPETSEAWEQMYNSEDLTLVTENHATIIPTKLRLHMVQHAMDPKRTESLISLWLKDYNKEMIAFKRQGRLEGLGIQRALEMQEDEKNTKL